MKLIIGIITFILVATGSFFNQTFSQGSPTSNLYQSAARRGVMSEDAGVAAPIRKQPQQLSETKIEPEVLVPLLPLNQQGILTTYIVTNTNDTGVGSFRRAITDANANAGLDRIVFNIPGGTVHTIMPLTTFPNITDSVIIDGSTQPGYVGKPLIELNGSLAPVGTNGLVIKAGHSIVRGLVINRFIANDVFSGMGIVLDQKGGNIIEGNYIGTNAAGDTAKGNGGSGVAIFGASSDNLIGGTTAAARNVISGNTMSGIQISTGSAGSNRIKGNYIGISATTWDSVGNLGNGIFIDAIGDSVGGDFSVAKNIIADNVMPGIALASNAMNTVIQGNSIGWLSGDVTWGNHDNGIAILGAQNIQIGGPTDEKRNLIAANAYPGIAIVGNAATGNIIEGNWIGGSLKIRPTNWALVSGNSIGVYIENAPGNVIGGHSVGSGNVISLNFKDGIVIRGSEATGNRIEGNTIGPSGTNSIVDAGNYQNGVFIDNAPNNIIGGSDSLYRNYIEGNFWNGIFINGDGATGNVVKGNIIGISPNEPISYYTGNDRDGIVLVASGNTIGGDGPFDGNVIAYNQQCGIFDSTGNHNTIRRNSIYSNQSLGIDLAPRGFTMNDSLDADAGANDGQNFPILDSARIDYPNSVQIYGRMNSSPNAGLRLDFYKSDTCNASKFGDGKTYIGSGMVYCDVTGVATFDLLILAAVMSQNYITATATSDLGSTSAFSRALRMLDSDGDGILDIWEERGGGIDWNCDGVIDLDLQKKNADPFHKDIFVEVDRMVGFLTHPEALAEVEQAFHKVKNKYVSNPDGNNGINLHVEYDPTETPITSELFSSDPWTRFFEIKAENFGTSDERKITNTNKENILNAKKLVYRYCLFGNQFGTEGYTGQANGLYRRNFIVTLGHSKWNDTLTGGGIVPGGKKDVQSGTFMHELGHTLGLRHGGNDDVTFYKPNYYSVMNYLWQFPKKPQRPGSWRLDYSPTVLATLDERFLDELHGLDPQPGDYDEVAIPYRRLDNTIGLARLAPQTSVDWDSDGDSTGYSSTPVDINHIVKSDPLDATETLVGYADWPNLQYNIRIAPEPSTYMLAKNQADTSTSMKEMTPEIYDSINELPPFGIIKPQSHWSQDTSHYTSIATGYYTDFEEQMIGNGEGGAIITWRHVWSENSGSDSSWDIRAQRIDSLGRILWDNNGISVSKGEKAPQSHSIVSDGSDGAIITWEDLRLGSGKHNIYSQHIDRYGREQWTSHGVAITSYTTQQPWLYSTSISDRRGGAIITWTYNNKVYAQRIDSTGTRQWATDGLLLMSVSTPWEYSVVSDGGGGAIVFWKNRALGGPYYFPWYAQRIDSTGTIVWGANGIQVSPTTTATCVASEDISGGAIVVFTDIPTDPGQKVCLQRIGPDGSLRWPLNGMQLDTVVTWAAKFSHQIVQDNAGAIMIGWLVQYNGVPNYDLFVQRADTAGVIKWQSGGVHIAGSIAQTDYFLVGTKTRRTIVLYPASRNEYRAQYFDSTGILPWSASGVPVNHGPYMENSGIHAVADNGNGAIVVFANTNWEVRGNTQYVYRHIYAQRLNETGGLGEGIVTGVNDGHSTLPQEFKLMQNYPNPFNPSTTIKFRLPVMSNVTVRIYNVLGQLVKELTNGIKTAGEHSVVWNTSSIASGVYFCRFEAFGTTNAKQSFTQVRKMILLK
jgi:hypothetical protein